MQQKRSHNVWNNSRRRRLETVCPHWVSQPDLRMLADEAGTQWTGRSIRDRLI